MANTLIFDLLKNKRLFAFDFDGVIVDSVNIKTEAFAEIYKPYGQKIVDRVINHHINNGGMSRFTKFKYYHNNYLNENIDESEIESMSSKVSNIVVAKVISSQWIIGIIEFLNKLKLKKIDCVIISATPQKELIQIIGAPVSVVVGKSELIYRVKVYNRENKLTFKIIEANVQSIIGWNEEQKFSTFFSLEKQTMVFTELLSGDHVAAYFYSCMRVSN